MCAFSLSCSRPVGQKKPDTPRFLITLDVGIGDAVAVGLRVVEQIIANEPSAAGTIDILCNNLQAQIFAADPRMNRIIATSKLFFPGVSLAQWLRGIVLDTEAARLVRFLKQRRYEAVFPSIIAPGLYFRLHTAIMYPDLLELAQTFLRAEKRATLQESALVKQMVDRYFRRTLPPASADPSICLYITSEHIQKARQTLEQCKKEAGTTSKVLLVAPDTASEVTRPPLELLGAALTDVLAARPDLLLLLLPSYTETARSFHLCEMLAKHHARRIVLLPSEPRAHLLELAALIDQADIFVCGDTGVMHLAATQRVLRTDDNMPLSPRNTGQVVVLFGGTNPGYFGYSPGTTIVGEGRKEQNALRPGFFKESYKLHGRNIFDHISSQQIVEAILR